MFSASSEKDNKLIFKKRIITVFVVVVSLIIAISLTFKYWYPIITNLFPIFNNPVYENLFEITKSSNGKISKYKPKENKTFKLLGIENESIYGADLQTGTYQTEFKWQNDTKYMCIYTKYPKNSADLAEAVSVFTKNEVIFEKEILKNLPSGQRALTDFKTNAKDGDVMKIVFTQKTKATDTDKAIFVFHISEGCTKTTNLK